MRGFSKQILRLAMIAAVFCLAATARDEEKISVVVTTANLPGTPAGLCQGSAEIPYMALHNLKINGKGDVRAMPVPQEAHVPAITRQEYEHAKGINLRDLTLLQLKDGFLYGLNQAGDTLLLFPQDKKPEKNTPTPIAEIYNVMVDGQLPGKSKEKRSVKLSAVQKIFTLNQNDPVEAALFLHAAQENNAVTWKGYLNIAHDYKLAEAMSGLHETLATCVNQSLEAYTAGRYPALKEARTAAMEAKGVADSPASQELLAKVEAEDKSLSDLITQANSLLGAGKWDESLTVLEPLKKYLGQLKELDSGCNRSLITE